MRKPICPIGLKQNHLRAKQLEGWVDFDGISVYFEDRIPKKMSVYLSSRYAEIQDIDYEDSIKAFCGVAVETQNWQTHESLLDDEEDGYNGLEYTADLIKSSE
jgi:hypothetical protein